MKPAAWHKHPIYVIDFEGNLETGIVEYGVVTFDQGVIADVYTGLCLAKNPIPAQDTSVHGILTEDTLRCESFEKQWDSFSAFRKKGPLAAHHAPYEDRLLRSVWGYCSASPDFLKGKNHSCDWGPWVDSCELYRALFKGLKSYQLSNLVSVFGLQSQLDLLANKYCPEGRKKYHCALYDALASALLLKNLLVIPAVRTQTLEWLLLSSMISDKKRQEHQQLNLF